MPPPSTSLIERLRRDFQCVVLDFPRFALRQQARVLTPPAAIVLVSDASLAGMRDTLRLSALLKSMVPEAETTVLLNRVAAAGRTSWAGRISRRAPRSRSIRIPDDVKAFAASAAAGKPVLKVAGRAKAALALRAWRAASPWPGRSSKLPGAEHLLGSALTCSGGDRRRARSG